MQTINFRRRPLRHGLDIGSKPTARFRDPRPSFSSRRFRIDFFESELRAPIDGGTVFVKFHLTFHELKLLDGELVELVLHLPDFRFFDFGNGLSGRCDFLVCFTQMTFLA